MRQQQPFYGRIATKMNVPSNPFRLGDKVQFVPQRTRTRMELVRAENDSTQRHRCGEQRAG